MRNQNVDDDGILLWIIFAVLMVALSPVEAAPLQGVRKDGTAYVCELQPPYPLVRFCVMFPADNLARR
jgi:hypothetical protein